MIACYSWAAFALTDEVSGLILIHVNGLVHCNMLVLGLGIEWYIYLYLAGLSSEVRIILKKFSDG